MSMIARWQINGNADDYFGLNNGNADIAWGKSKMEGIYSGSFNGSSNKIDLSSALDLYSNETNFSFSFWTRFTKANIDDWDRIFSETQDSSYGLFYSIVAYSSGKIGMQIKDSNGVVVDNTSCISDSDIGDDAWHHVVLIDANGTISGYIDGKNETGFDDTYARASITIDSTEFGYLNRPTPIHYFTGNLDDFRIYNVALTAAEVKELYNSYFIPTGQLMSQTV